jgi:hypothetical protein
MQTTRSKIEYLPTTILIIVTLFVWVLSFSDIATADMYTDSAHGDHTSGVNRSVEYGTGDCAHCHETFDGSTCIQYNFMLFYDDVISICDLFCFKCHNELSTLQPVDNYLYSVNFGGYPPPGPYQSIYQQFCNVNSTPDECGSRHHLGQIYNSLISPTVDEWGFSDDPDPCVACHNPHAAEENHPVEIVEGKLNTAIRRPSHYKSTNPADSLWGDDPFERMDQYVSQFTDGVYQPPYYGDTSDPDWELAYEPSGNAIPSDGSDLPDYVTFCLDCHQHQLWDPEKGEFLRAIDWSQERHGGWPSNTCTQSYNLNSGYREGSVKTPYSESDNSNYVLSCLDCHEPHGTINRTGLIRRVVNGQVLPPACNETNGLCEACHDWPHSGSCVAATQCHGYTDAPPGEEVERHGGHYTYGEGAACGTEPAF